jgi:hypothetical protein
MMTDPLTGAATIVGLTVVAKPAAELVKDFLGKMLAPTGDAIGKSLAYPIVEWQKRRVARANKLVADAAAAVAESGREPQPVPGRLLMPILERGSLEEDAQLHERWVDLLRNAAIDSTEILPSFVTILGELSAAEAHVLQTLNRFSAQRKTTSHEWDTTVMSLALVEEMIQSVGGDQRMEVIIANLRRLALIETPTFYRTNESENLILLRLSPFGITFVRACSRPEGIAG